MRLLLSFVACLTCYGQMFPFPGPGLPPVASTPPSFVSCSYGHASSTTLTVTATATSTTTGHALYCSVGSSVGAGPCSTDFYTTPTLTDTALDTFSNVNCESGSGQGFVVSFVAKNITGNVSNVVTATWTGTNNDYAIVCSEVANANISSPYDQKIYDDPGGGAVASVTSQPFTTTTANEVLFATLLNPYAKTVVPDTGWTMPNSCTSENNNTSRLNTQYKAVTSIQTGATTTMTYSNPSGLALMNGVTIK